MRKAQNALRKQKPQHRGTYRISKLEVGLENAVQQSIMSVRTKIDIILKKKENIADIEHN